MTAQQLIDILKTKNPDTVVCYSHANDCELITEWMQIELITESIEDYIDESGELQNGNIIKLL